MVKNISEILLEMNEDLNRIQDIDELLGKVLLNARLSVNADAGSIYIKKGDRLFIKYAQNDTIHKRLRDGEKMGYSSFPIDIDKTTLSGFVALTGESVNIENVYEISEDKPYTFSSRYDEETHYRTVSCLTFPLITNQDEIVGVLQLINRMDAHGKISAFSDNEIHFLRSFASLATIALQRASITRAIMMRMIKMAGLRDPKETGAHVHRVAGYSVEIFNTYAEKQGYSDEDREHYRDKLRMAAMLHDVGKVGISDTVLKKSAKFTREEFLYMQKHTIIGAHLFAEKESELDNFALEVALRHHENWNGTGYPGHIDLHSEKPLRKREDGTTVGLKGDEIPLSARIVSIADVYDALRTNRTYKSAWNEDEVLDEIRKCANTKFDPELVQVFFEIQPTIRAISERYKDEQVFVKENIDL